MGVCCGFHLPEIPVSLTQPEQRADYLAAHYWDAFDFADTASIAAAEQVEPVFVDFLTVLPLARSDVRGQAIAAVLENALRGAEGMFPFFADLFEKYLWEPASPLRSDEGYILVLQWIVASPEVPPVEKIRPRALLELAQRNRPGAVAADFTLTLFDGQLLRLSELNCEYTLLFFNTPDCVECLSAKSLLACAASICNTPGLRVVAVYPRGDESSWRRGRYPSAWINGWDAGQVIDAEGLYDLRQLPAIYLLDRHKQVLLKNATVREIETLLSK